MRKNINLNKPIIRFERVGKIYEPRHEVALRDSSFDVKEGEFVCFIGPSGCGKSTVLKIIAGLEKETSGTVTKPQSTSMVFQSGALFPWLTVFANVAVGPQSQNLDKGNVKKESMKYIEMMGLGDLIDKYPRELSGGQRQRVGIARALAANPSVLLLDEPFSSLDPKITEELHKDVIKAWTETKKTIVMVSHSIEEAVSLAERIILMKNFSIAEVFPISLTRPRHEQGAGFASQVLEIRREFFE